MGLKFWEYFIIVGVIIAAGWVIAFSIGFCRWVKRRRVRRQAALDLEMGIVRPPPPPPKPWSTKKRVIMAILGQGWSRKGRGDSNGGGSGYGGGGDGGGGCGGDGGGGGGGDGGGS